VLEIGNFQMKSGFPDSCEKAEDLETAGQDFLVVAMGEVGGSSKIFLHLTGFSL
jgi:hypothetical protein